VIGYLNYTLKQVTVISEMTATLKIMGL